MEENNEKKVEKKQPKLKFKSGAFRCTVWENFKKDNPTEKYNSITLERVYKLDGSDEWKTERINLFDKDIYKVVQVLVETSKELNVKQE